MGWSNDDPDSRECSCDWLNDDDQDDTQEFSGVGTLMIITVLGGLFIWFNLMPRSCAQDSRSQREPRHQLQQRHHFQHTRTMLQMELKEDKFKDAGIDSYHEIWHDVINSEDDDLEKLNRNLVASQKNPIKATAISISLPVAKPIHFLLHKSEPNKEAQRVKHLTESHTDLPTEINETEIYHDLSLDDSDDERFQDPLSENSEEDRFVDSLDN